MVVPTSLGSGGVMLDDVVAVVVAVVVAGVLEGVVLIKRAPVICNKVEEIGEERNKLERDDDDDSGELDEEDSIDMREVVVLELELNARTVT